MAEKQQGAVFTFGTDAITLKIVSIGRYSEPIPVIDDTDLSTTVRRTKMPGELGDPQMLTLVLQGNGKGAHPVKGKLQTGTITAPIIGANLTAEKWSGSGFVADIRTPEYASDTEGITTIEIDWQFDGKTGPTRTLAT